MTTSSSTSDRSPADYIVPLNISGLQGRMLHIPAREGKKRNIMFVYGHHSSLERWWGLMEVFNDYGSITMPDLPGFGGMDSFYKVRERPTVDALADYLAAFIKWRYKRTKVTLVGMSFGFVIVTRMLQRYPELTSKVELLISLVGFAHKDDFTFSKTRYWSYRLAVKFFSYKLPAAFFRHVLLNRYVLHTVYARTHNAKNKFADVKTKDDFERLMTVEIGLWQDNDLRTWMFTSSQFLQLNNCTKKVDLPVWHISVKADHFFDNHIVEQHMRIIFTDFHGITADVKGHAPSVIANAEAAGPLVPEELRQLLSQPVNQIFTAQANP